MCVCARASLYFIFTTSTPSIFPQLSSQHGGEREGEVVEVWGVWFVGTNRLCLRFSFVNYPRDNVQLCSWVQLAGPQHVQDPAFPSKTWEVHPPTFKEHDGNMRVHDLCTLRARLKWLWDSSRKTERGGQRDRDIDWLWKTSTCRPHPPITRFWSQPLAGKSERLKCCRVPPGARTSLPTCSSPDHIRPGIGSLSHSIQGHIIKLILCSGRRLQSLS